MTDLNLLTRTLVSVLAAGAITVFLDIPAGATPAPDQIITNMASYRHPVKAAFQRVRWDLKKIALYRSRTFPVFYADAPYDVRLAHNDHQAGKDLEVIARANGYWSFKVIFPIGQMEVTVKGNPQQQRIEAIEWGQ